ncbi:MAG: homoserine O-acetyltransferase [Luminiphilus sp.]|nr:homoserine O-acetyltransferase [Luminiphilus sp.]MBL6897134.1 homoserine O-acetyltransferase [Luminiphilus sp.]
MKPDLSAQSVGLVTPQVAHFDTPFQLSNGATLDQHQLIFETYGELNASGTNAVLICHALSGSHHAAGIHDATEQRPGWWDLAIGPGKPIDTNRLFVVCSNNLGGCDGSTGPNTPMPGTSTPWGSQFPQPQVRDWVRSQKLLAEYLGISRWAAVVGGSLGGMQALQWAIDFPDWVEHCVALASAPGLTAQNIAFNEIARHAILSDPDFRGGNYLAQDALPVRGVALARMVGHLTYMSADGMSDRFGRELREESFSRDGDQERVFQVESYLRHQGARFSTRFDANTYVLMTRALDLFDLSEGYTNLTTALSRAEANFLLLSFSSDWRFAPQRSIEIRDALMAAGKAVTCANIQTDNGHDGFLLPHQTYERLLAEWMQRVGRS